MRRFENMTVIVTGTASGIGREAALGFAIDGAHVVGADLDADGGEETAAACREAGGAASFVRTDVSVEEDMVRLVEHAMSRAGRVDILFNNAGWAGGMGPTDAFSTELWNRVLGTCLTSVFLGIKHVSPHMKRQGSGAIISTSSIAGERGFANSPAYCTAKAGIINLTRAAAVELGPHGIRVNCVAPGFILTPMQPRSGTVEELERELRGRQPIAVAGKPKHVFDAVAYLASDASSWVTGQTLTVDGGAVAGIWTYAP